MCVFDVLPATLGHFVCKIADTQLVYDFSALNRGPNPVHVIFFFFFNIPLYICKSRQLQPFARIHKSWIVLVRNVVLGLNVEFQSMSSVDGDYKLTHTYTHVHGQDWGLPCGCHPWPVCGLLQRVSMGKLNTHTSTQSCQLVRIFRNLYGNQTQLRKYGKPSKNYGFPFPWLTHALYV